MARLDPSPSERYNESAKVRFLRFVRVNKVTGCWQWTGGKDAAGYGLFSYQDRRERAHRAGYVMWTGISFEEGQVGMHLCDNPGCANPEHIQPGSHQENTQDKLSKGRGSKLMPEDVRAIRTALDANEKVKLIAKRYSVNEQTIYSIASGKRWGWLT